MSDETYNGYTNRETWAFNLHWQNDQGLYSETLELAREWIGEYPHFAEADLTCSHLGAIVVSHWRDMAHDDETEYLVRDMSRDIGSWWRINNAEVGAAVRESLDNES